MEKKIVNHDMVITSRVDSKTYKSLVRMARNKGQRLSTYIREMVCENVKK